jgi:hypothetical protein
VSVWKEIRCDGDPNNDACQSNRNSGPQGFESVTELHRQARANGWQVKAGEAICPSCRKAKP